MTGTLAATYTISSADIVLSLVVLGLMVMSGIFVYRTSEQMRVGYGITPWRLPSWLWVIVVVVFFPWTLLLYLLAWATSRPRGGVGRGGPGPYFGGQGPYGGPGPYPYGHGPYGHGPYAPGPYGPPGNAPGQGAAGPYGPPGHAPGQGGPGGPTPPPHPGAPTPPPYPGGPTPPPYPGGPTPPPYPGGPTTPPHPGGPGWSPVPGPDGSPGAASWPADPSGLPPPPNPAEGWYVDPTERFFLRYWDGQRWTDRVASGGRESTDPVTPDR